MQIVAGQVAVITGAGSGIGWALANACVACGLQVVAADCNAERLAALAAELAEAPSAPLCRQVDVAERGQLAQLADEVYARYGAVHLLFNNAGLLRSGRCWESPVDDWQRLINVNLLSVLHAIQLFVPRMLAQQAPAHIVNTASLAGLLAAPQMGAYSVSKHAVVALSQTLHYELQEMNADVGVSVACPAQVQSNIAADLADNNNASGQLNDFLRSGIAAGMPAAQLAERMLAAVAAEQFWVFSHPDFKAEYLRRARELTDERSPQFQLTVCQ